MRNVLQLMDRPEPWPDANNSGQLRWLTQIEARNLIAADPSFLDTTTGKPLNDHAQRRYATGAKGATARDRLFMRKHLLMKNGEPIFGPDGLPMRAPPPAPSSAIPSCEKQFTKSGGILSNT